MRSFGFYNRAPKLAAVTFAATLVSLNSGCATLPSSGPTGSQITKTVVSSESGLDIQINELDRLSAIPLVPAKPAVFRSDYVAPPTDLIAAGDQIDISIFEAGVTLFAGGGAKLAGATTGAFESSSQVQHLPVIRVDDDGYIRLPYLGRMHAAGSTTAELASKIRKAYLGMSQNPQVLVSLREAIGNSIILGGEVARPGRLVLSTNKESLGDAIALAGGYRGEAKDLALRIERKGETGEFRLSDVLSGEVAGMRAFPGDRITLIRAPRSFSVLGASGRAEQIPFATAAVNLAEAVALAGGVNPNAGDPAAIFVFRFETQGGVVDRPTVYHLNMMNAGSYLISQRFQMHDKDVLYVSNARANQPSKLIQIVSQLFAPIVTVQNVVRTTGN